MEDDEIIILKREVKRKKHDFTTIAIKWETKVRLDRFRNRLGKDNVGMDIIIKLLVGHMEDYLEKKDKKDE